MKYILVTGGVISGIGKGITSSSVGALLKCCGFKVTAIKIDPYLNIDAGTFSPYEHGEVFVLDDGGEVDLDLGNYERFLDLTLTSENNITTGKIYSEVIRKERLGLFMGKTVQVVPHITDEIQDWITRVARISVDKSTKEPDVCIIELGGTIGDIESAPFVEAFRQFQFRVGSNNFLNIHVSLIPCQSGELKSKPTQNSVKELRAQGITADILMCRSEKAITPELKEKLSMFCQVPASSVICVEDANVIYEVPVRLYRQKVHEIIMRKLQLSEISAPKKEVIKWKKMCDQYKRPPNIVNIALVGKYVKLDDAYISVNKALDHAALECGFKLDLIRISAEHLVSYNNKSDEYLDSWKQLTKANGVIVPGGFDKRGVDGKMAAISHCRQNNVPILGVCLGMQCMVIEFARSVLGWSEADSSEFNPECTRPVIVEMPEFNPEQKGGTMRLGKRETFFHTNSEVGDRTSKIHLLYRTVPSIFERHRHRYEVNPEFISEFERAGLKFVGRDSTEQRMEILELDDHPYFVGTQYHPEYLSRPNRPTPPYLGLVMAATNCLHRRLRLDQAGGRARNDSVLLTDDEEDDPIQYKDMRHNGNLLHNGTS